MKWFGHRAGCGNGRTPTYRGSNVLVCRTCMPELVPCCGICGMAARELGVLDGFRHLSFVGLCPGCVATVRAAGPWRERREAALAARVGTLLEAHEQLTAEHARSGKRVVLSGIISDRHARFTLKLGAREHEDERYIFRIELRTEHLNGPLDPAAVRFPDDFAPRMSRGSPRIMRDDHRWLRVAFLHLGRTDTLTVVQSMLAAATALDGE